MNRDRLFQPLTDSIRCLVKRIVWISGETHYTVMKAKIEDVKEPVTVVGVILDVRPGEELRLEGRWEDNPRFGRQFKFNHATRLQPSTRNGIVRYLGSGMIDGVGPKLAERIVNHFGLDTLRILQQEPHRISEVRGIGKQRALRIGEAWAEQHALQEIMIFLQGYDITHNQAVKIFKRYGNETITILRENPYQLATDIRGIGFRSADRIARSLGIDLDSPFRAQAATLFYLQQMRDRGHTYYPRALLLEELQKELEVRPERAVDAILELQTQDQLIVEVLENDERAVFLSTLAACERGASGILRRMVNVPNRVYAHDLQSIINEYEHFARISLASAQRDAIEMGARSQISIITGGPGTGKTTIMRGVCYFLQKHDAQIVLAAPTGRAAKRLSETTGLEAKTLHRLLEFSPQNYEFQRNQENPLEADMVIVDEASMIDIFMLYALLRAVPEDAQLLLVGDADQLPSVGPGNVLRDLIDSRVIPFTRLDQIYRQKDGGYIVENAHRVNIGQKPSFPKPSKEKLHDFYFVPHQNPQKAVQTIVQLVTERIPERFALDPLKDIQVISPMHRGEVGVQNLNTVLQQHFASQEESLNLAGQRFFVGDRVIQTRNNYDKEVFNGDVGQVIDVDTNRNELAVDFDGIELTYSKEELDELSLAYAISVHKSQGSEYPAIVLPLFTQHYMMLQRNLIYTAITRAKKLVVVVGNDKALNMAISNDRIKHRFSRLKERLSDPTAALDEVFSSYPSLFQ